MFFFRSDYQKKRKEVRAYPDKSNRSAPCRKRTFLLTFRMGSLTVEAACVLPLFVYGMLLFLRLLPAVAAAGSIGEGLHETAEQMAVYASALDGENGEAAQVVSLLYAGSHVKSRAGELVSGLNLLHSSILEEDEMIDLVAVYQIPMQVPFFPTKKLSLCQRARVRAWVGRSDAGEGEGEQEEEEMVYITVNGQVYHRSRECSHLRLSVRSVAKAGIGSLRNSYGAKYYPCEACGGGSGLVYITDTGNRYHSSLSCSGLKRGILEVPISQVEGWPACSRCG